MTDSETLSLIDLDVPIVKCYRQLVEGEEHPMRTKEFLQEIIDPIVILYPELALEERIKRFNNMDYQI